METKYSTYIAISNDGFIADKNGSIDFLNNLKIESDAGYEKYYKSINGLIYGSKTYEKIKSFNLEKWPYKGKKQWVLTSNPKKYKNTNEITFIKSTPKEIDKIINLGHIWVMGGANVINQFIQSQMLSEMFIFKAEPINLKSGTKLFDKNVYKKFDLVNTKSHGELIEYHYTIKK